METLSAISFLAFVGFLIATLVQKIRKKKIKLYLIAAIAFFVLSMILAPTNGSKQVKNASDASVVNQTSVSSSATSVKSDGQTAQNSPGLSATPTGSAPSNGRSAQVPSATNGTLAVNYLNVGQGDSEFIELPNGQTMLIDAGNSGDGDKIVTYIKNKGYSKIDYLIATHPHADHIGGMTDIVNGISISNVYMPNATTTTNTYKNLITAIKNKGIPTNIAKSGVSLIDTTDLKVYMVAPNSTKYDDLNNYSAVIRIVYKNNSFLFMGDTQTISEDEIIKAGYDLKSDVLKVGHHGSDTSTGKAFLQKVSPKYAIIEVGTGNDYGHPKQTTLDKLAAINATVYRTDKDNTIIIASDGSNLSITTSNFSSISSSSASIGTSSKATLSATTATVPVSPPVVKSSSPNDGDTIVYITKTGSKYHTAGCPYLKDGGTPISLTEAKAKGLTPCSKCNPPS